MRLLVTRPMPEAKETADRLRQLGHEAVVAPMLTIEPLRDAAIPLDGIGALAVTSGRAVDAVAGRREWESLRKLPLFTVGEKTAEKARSAGAQRIVAGGGTVATLVERIAAEGYEGSLLYLAGSERSGDLAGALQRRGMDCRMVEVYTAPTETALPAEAVRLLKAGRIDCILVYSRRTAESLAAALSGLGKLPGLRFACISQNAGAPLADLGRVEIAGKPEEQALFALL